MELGTSLISCGVRQIYGLRNWQEEWKEKFTEATRGNARFVIFSDNNTGLSAHGGARGEGFAEHLKKQGYNVTETEGWRRNPNSGQTIKVWVVDLLEKNRPAPKKKVVAKKKVVSKRGFLTALSRAR